MTKPTEDERFNRTLKRMLRTPPKPHDEMKKGRLPGKRLKKVRPRPKADDGRNDQSD